MSSTIARYTVCATYSDVAAAVQELSRDPNLILDCEGRELGMPGGALSIIAIGNATASRIFPFDVLALSYKSEPSLAPLFALLRSPDVTKVVWDGRSDFLEIADTYGVPMGGVIDLQLAEVAQRARTVKPNQMKKIWRYKHTADYFKRIQTELDADPSALDGIFRLYGLDHCAMLYQIVGKTGGKDRAVVSLHQQNGSEMWMHRPLPQALLQYAAHDIEIIARLFARLQEKGRYLSNMDALKDMSTRYMRVYTRELNAMHVPLQLKRFLPLDLLEAPLDGTPRYRCERCERMLSLQCYTTAGIPYEPAQLAVDTVDDAANILRRLSFCRLCSLLARRDAEVALGEGVLILQ